MPEPTPIQGWKTVSLGQIAQLRQETVQPEDAPYLPYVGLEHIDPGDTVLRRYGKAEEVTSTKNCFYSGDVLYGKLRPYLDKAALAQNPGMCSTDILVLRATEHALADFLALLLHTQALRDHAVSNTNGVNHPRTSWQALSNFSLRLPFLSEQRDIARILRAVQAAREARQREVGLERERKAALMAHLFTHGTRGEPTKQTAIGVVPSGWKIAELSEVVDIIYGVQAAVAHLLDESKGTPIFTNINITDEGSLDLSTLRYYEVPDNKRDRLILHRGDLLFNWRSGSQRHVGKTALFDLEGEFTFSSFILRFRVGDSVINSYLLYYLHYLRATGFFLQSRQQSSVNSTINASIASTLPVLLPDKLEQERIAATLRACDAKIAALERESALLDELFRGLLEELMTGWLSVAGMEVGDGE